MCRCIQKAECFPVIALYSAVINMFIKYLILMGADEILSDVIIYFRRLVQPKKCLSGFFLVYINMM